MKKFKTKDLPLLRDGGAIAGIIAVITFLHYSTDVSFAYFHDIYKVLYYIPIILASFRFGASGGLAVAFGISLLYTPHVTQAWSARPEVIVNRFVEMVIFLVVAFITGKLVENERDERRRYEKAANELRDAYEKLESRSEYVAEVEEQLRVAERLATLGELTASLAHEVRNPLAAIKGTAEILRDDYPKDGENEEFFNLIINDVDRIDKVIGNYLRQVVPSRSKQERFDVVQATKDVAHILRARARKEAKHLRLSFLPHLLMIQGEEIKFRQLLLNLLLNALAATRESDSIVISMRLHGENGPLPCLEVAIKDTGCGIKDDELENIFKPFYTTRDDGTGLGLPIVKRIAEEYGWQLCLESTYGRGTTVTLKIQVNEEQYDREENPARG